VDPNGLIRRMEGMARSISGATVDVEIELGEEVPAIRADPGRIEQAVINLVVNARDAMPDGGRMTLRTAEIEVSPGEDGPAGLNLAPGSYASIEVEDTGVGMEDEVRSRAFEPFFTTKSRGRGTGLGLSAVYGVVSGLGGTVHVDSSPGGGSTFTLYVPAADSAHV